MFCRHQWLQVQFIAVCAQNSSKTCTSNFLLTINRNTCEFRAIGEVRLLYLVRSAAARVDVPVTARRAATAANDGAAPGIPTIWFYLWTMPQRHVTELSCGQWAWQKKTNKTMGYACILCHNLIPRRYTPDSRCLDREPPRSLKRRHKTKSLSFPVDFEHWHIRSVRCDDYSAIYSGKGFVIMTDGLLFFYSNPDWTYRWRN